MSAEPFSQCLEAQAAAIARRQGQDVGVDPETMRTRVRSGRWQRLQRGVYAAFSGDPARETVLWAALLRAGPGAVLSHQTAAERHGLIDEPSPVITITVPASGRPARAKIPGVAIHRSDAILRTRHPAMLPPCTRVEDTVLDLIQIAPTFDDAYAWICRAVGRRRTTADRIRQAMDARKKMRWRRELVVALGDAGEGALSLLEYRYVHRVERPHGLPAARRQVRIRQRTGNRYLDNLYEEYGVCSETRRDRGASRRRAVARQAPRQRQRGPRHRHAQVRPSRPRRSPMPDRGRRRRRAAHARLDGGCAPLLSAEPAPCATALHDRGQFWANSTGNWPRS